MKNLLIIGARGFGREVFVTALNSVGYGVDFVIKGFLDDKQDALLGYENYPPIISSVEDYNVESNDVFICALGDVHFKKMYVEKILKKKGVFINIIEKNVIFGLNTKFGVGCIFRSYVNISVDVSIGDFNTFQPYCVIGHDSKIGNFCHLNTYSFMGGYSVIEDNVTIQTGGILLPHKKAQNEAVIGAGSVALKNVKEGKTVFGLPACEF
jgi:sugar O-acyltransferase (sialic acid O-acetyltransferase NeuD family)